MGWFSKLLVILIIINGIQNMIIGYVIRGIVSDLGKEANYVSKKMSDQIFLYKKIKSENNEVDKKSKKLLYYSFFASFLQVFLFLLLIISLSGLFH